MKVVSQVVCTSCTTMAIEDSKEANLWPLGGQVLFWLGLENVQNDGDSVFVVVSDDTLIGVGSIWFDHATLLLGGLCGLMVFQKECFWVQCGWILSKKQSLDFHELNVGILVRALTQSWRPLIVILLVLCGSFRLSTCGLGRQVSVCAVESATVVVVQNRWGRLAAVWNATGWQCHALSETSLIDSIGRLWLCNWVLMRLGGRIDAQRVDLCARLIFRRTLSLLRWVLLLSNSYELGVGSLTTHNVSSRWEDTL